MQAREKARLPAERPCIYVGNYVSYYVDKKLKPWHYEK